MSRRDSTSRYRKIEVKIWGDEKFRSLSPIPPCGQGLWLYLLTGPHTGPIPGLFRAGRAAMAEELGWELEAFGEAFGEALSKGLIKADWKARVVWIPKAIFYNKPESPNVVKSWASEWNLIPECDLKDEAYAALKASISSLGEAFDKAFDKAFGKPSAKASDKPSGKAIDNQEQEQDKDKNIPPLPPKGGGAKPRSDSGRKPKFDPLGLCPPNVTPEVWAQWCQHRREIKHPLTQTSCERQATLLAAHGNADEIIRQSITAGWQGLFPDRVPASPPQDPKPLSGGAPDDWWRQAGFNTVWDAENADCTPRNFREFRNGVRIGAAGVAA